MILTLALIFAALIVTAWITAMYIWWNKERGHALAPLGMSDINAVISRYIRLIRRMWYTSMRYGSKAAEKSGNTVLKGFFTLFPSAEQAFTHRDELTGLKQGPSSYFLLSISESRKKVARKKIIS